MAVIVRWSIDTIDLHGSGSTTRRYAECWSDRHEWTVKFDDRVHAARAQWLPGYQNDVRISNGHVGEFRLHMKSLDDVAHWEHSLYELRRDLRTMEQTRPLTPTEAAIRNGSIREEQRLFGEARQPALPEEG